MGIGSHSLVENIAERREKIIVPLIVDEPLGANTGTATDHPVVIGHLYLIQLTGHGVVAQQPFTLLTPPHLHHAAQPWRRGIEIKMLGRFAKLLASHGHALGIIGGRIYLPQTVVVVGTSGEVATKDRERDVVQFTDTPHIPPPIVAHIGIYEKEVGHDAVGPTIGASTAQPV